MKWWIYLGILIVYTYITNFNAIAFIGWAVFGLFGLYYLIYFGSRAFVKFVLDLIEWGRKYSEK